MKKNFYYSSLLLLFFTKNPSKGFTPLGFLVRVFLYSGVLITLILPCLDAFKTESFSYKQESEANINLEIINRNQQDFLGEMGRFADSLRELPISLTSSFYSFQMISPMLPVTEIANNSSSSTSFQTVFTIAQPLPHYSNSIRSYIGAVFYETNTGNSITGICQINAVKTLPTTVPILKRNQTIQCPPGSTLLSSSTNLLR